jgi:hypothetical protein
MQEEKRGCGCGEKWKMNVSYAGADPLTARSRARKSDTGADAGVAENSLNDPVPTAVPLIHIV